MKPTSISSTGDITILAMDDDTGSLEMLDYILSGDGCRVIKAHNGLDGVRILEQTPEIDVMLVDLEMPVMNGYEFITLTRQSIVWQNIPIVVLTADSREAVRTMSMGANDFVAKPYNREELHLRVMNQARTKKMADQAQKSLRQSETRLEQLLQATDQGIYSIDLEGNCTFINRPGMLMLGFQQEEIIGRNINSLIYHDTASRQDKRLPPHTHMLDGNICRDDDLLLTKRDGSTFPASFSSHPLVIDGTVAGAVVTFTDITVMKNTLDELTTAKELAEAASFAKSSFLATMSHEIRTPMNGVLGMNSMLLETKLTAEQKEYAEIVRKSGENLLTIINEILDFSKIEAGKLELEILDLDLRITLEDTAELLAIRAEAEGLELICNIAPEVPCYLKGDPGRVRQIITNLTGNAIKFTRKGEVVISANLESEQDGMATILFEITDTGIGIPESRLSAIFDPFTQADGSTTRKFGGTGLGLAICKQLTLLMGGEIGVKSREGCGSTFWFRLTFEKQPSQTTAIYKSLQSSGQSRLSQERIMVVDDNATNRILMKTILRQWGCRFELASHSTEALEMLRGAAQSGDPFRLAILDQEMPDIDGMELGKCIKADPQIASTLLVMLTSIGMRGDATILEQIGFAGYLHKPVRQTQLYDCIELVLARDAGTGDDENATVSQGIVTRHIIAEAVRPGVRILLAEDNIINQKVAQHMLKTIGYRVDVVADGLEAVRALEMINYDLVLMDCMMPIMNGFEATVAIRGNEYDIQNRKVPIIAMTANATLGDREKCIEFGMDDYLSKPVRKEELAALIEKWLAFDPLQENQSNNCVNNSTLTFFEKDAVLERMDNDIDFVRVVLEETLQSQSKELSELRTLCDVRDAAAIRRQAHTLKGMAVNIAAPALRDICLRIETAAKDNDVETASELLPELEHVSMLTAEAIKNALF